MSKKPVAYIKPQEPSFITKLKKEAGFVEGPTVDTKREVRGLDSGSDEEHDLQPVVVVLKDGDLTAAEAADIERKKKEEEDNAKADLTKRVVFQRPTNTKRVADAETSDKKKKKIKSEKLDKKTKSLLSFDEEDEG